MKFPKLFKHVGTKFGTNLDAEVSARSAIMTSGATCLKKKILHNENIKLDKRIAILSAYVFTKGTFQCCTWSELSPAAFKKINGSILGLYRSAIGMCHGNKNNKGNITDSDLLYRYDITNPDTMIRTARLSVWFRILCEAPMVLTMLCHDMASKSIGRPEAVKQDLRWLSGSSVYSSTTERTFEDWSGYIRANSKSFRGLIKKYSKTRCANCYCPSLAAHGSPEQPATFG